MTADAAARARIREDLDTSFLVEAAAGTGKTQCFVDRVVEAVARGRARVEGLVAVTFTRKAAGELRLRIRQALLARRGAAQVWERPRIEDALVRLEEARIGTIHGFCAELLRRHPVVAGIDPGFDELDEDEARRLRERAFSTWFEAALDGSDPVLRRALTRAENRRGTPREELFSAFDTAADLRDLGTAWTPVPFDPEAAGRPVWAAIAELAPLVDQAPPGHRAVIGQTRLDLVAEVFQRWSGRFADGDVDPVDFEADLVELARRVKKPRRALRGRWTDEIGAPEVENRIEALVAALGAHREQADASFAPQLRARFDQALAIYDELKRASGKLDHVDLLLKARALLRDHPEARRHEAEQIDFIGVDELQDTDPVQTEIVMRLSRRQVDADDGALPAPDPGRVFFVGDPKQAIYGFRRASMGFYRSMRAAITACGVERLELTHSFRAVQPIQSLVNQVFAPVFGTPESPEPSQPGYVPLSGGPEPVDGQPAVMVISAQLSKEPSWRQKRDALTRATMESVATFLEWLVRESGFRVRGDGGVSRPVQARDVGVLFRKMSFPWFERDRIPDLCNELERRDLPFSLVGRSRLAERDEVEAIRTALRAIEWPSDELAVYGTLVGPIFALPDEALWAYRRRYGRLHPLEVPDASPEQSPVAEALGLLRELSRTKAQRPVAQTLTELFEPTRALAAFAHEPAGSEVLAHVDLVLELARAHERRGPASVRSFLEELDRARTRDGSERPVEEHVEGIRLMTVHKAKGLEFPVVVLADPMSTQWASKTRFIDGETGQAAFEVLGCAPRELVDRAEAAAVDSRAEESRLAYVAATRARDLLVISGYGFGWPPIRTRTPEVSWFGPFDRHLYPSGEPERLDVLGGDPADPWSAFWPEGADEGPNPIRAGRYRAGGDTPYVWVARSILRPERRPRTGLARETAFVDGPDAEASVHRYEAWRAQRSDRITRGSVPSEDLIRASEAFAPPPGDRIPIRKESVPRPPGRPSGPRFGQLVHGLLEAMPWDADPSSVRDLAEHVARPLGAPGPEIEAATATALAARDHRLLREASRAERCLREVPIILRTDTGEIVDGVIDLLYFADRRWTVVDYKTGRLDELPLAAARNQVAWYVDALRRIHTEPVRAFLLEL